MKALAMTVAIAVVGLMNVITINAGRHGDDNTDVQAGSDGGRAQLVVVR